MKSCKLANEKKKIIVFLFVNGNHLKLLHLLQIYVWGYFFSGIQIALFIFL